MCKRLTKGTNMRGPIDYIIVGFDGNKFDGSILRALANAVDDGVINLIALSAIVKDEGGDVQTLDIAELGDDYMIEFTQTHALENDLITGDDIDEVSDLLVEGSAAGLLVIEHVWAKPLKEAIIGANGYLIAEGRIHPEATLELNAKGE